MPLQLRQYDGAKVSPSKVLKSYDSLESPGVCLHFPVVERRREDRTSRDLFGHSATREQPNTTRCAEPRCPILRKFLSVHTVGVRRFSYERLSSNLRCVHRISLFSPSQSISRLVGQDTQMKDVHTSTRNDEHQAARLEALGVLKTYQARLDDIK